MGKRLCYRFRSFGNFATIRLMKYFFLFALLFLSACGGTSNKGLTPMPSTPFTGPPDSVLFEDVSKYVAAMGKPANSTYKHARIDLNNDGLLDGIVLFRLPHQSWCGWDGCGMAIFKAGQKNFTPAATIGGVRGPIYVLGTSNDGWRDIVIRMTGMKTRDKNVLMKFDGRTYPNHAMMGQAYTLPLSRVKKKTLFK